MESRSITYLRLSITDKCDMRCIYCRPRGASVSPETSPLSIHEITRLVRAFAENGITKVRLTGGEPLARPDAVEIANAIASAPGIETIGLTTNGFRLAEMAQELARAGVGSINISLDSLDSATFYRITGRDAIDKVLSGIDAALRCGFRRVKINTVVMRGVNDSEVIAIAGLANSMPVEVRFIELMPLGGSRDVWRAMHVPASETRSMLGDISPLPHENGSSARLYSLAGGGIIGIISPISETFCAQCNRIRVTCAGRAKPCLRLPIEQDLRPLLDGPDLTDELSRVITRLAPCKLTTGSAENAIDARAVCMIGG